MANVFYIRHCITMILYTTVVCSTAVTEPSEVIRSGLFQLEKYDIKKTFSEAKAECEGRNTWLVEVKTEEIHRDLSQLASTDEVWVGGEYSYMNGWHWTDGSRIVGKRWVTNSFHSRSCVSMKNYVLKEEPCNWSYHYVCQVVMPWTFFYGNKEYRIFEEAQNSYGEAQGNCSSWHYGATLINIPNQETESRIDKELNQRGEKNDVFTSGNDLRAEGFWMWSESFWEHGAYENWNKYTLKRNEPNGGDYEDCLVKSQYYDWKWQDKSCWSKAKPVCQRNLFQNICSRDLCSNRGECKVKKSPTTGQAFRCHCETNFHGRVCEIDPCYPNPCQHFGTCAERSDHPFYICTCPLEYTGSNCESEVYTTRGSCQYHINLAVKLTQAQAARKCTSLNSTLALLKIDSQKSHILQEIRRRLRPTNQKVWVGGIKRSNTWIWQDGEIIDSVYVTHFSLNNKCVTFDGQTRRTTATSCDQTLGYVCEKPAGNQPCEANRCKNGATCTNVGCHLKCTCKAGYNGTYCDFDLMTVTALESATIAINKGDSANVTLNIVSYVGNVTIYIGRYGARSYYGVPQGKLSLSIGPFMRPTPGEKITVVVRDRRETFERKVFFTITVLDKPSVQLDRSWIFVPRQHHSYVTCTASGEPVPSVLWYKGNKEVSTGPTMGIYQKTVYGHKKRLYFNYASKTDAGIYTCRASNRLGPNMAEEYDEKSVFLRVKLSLVTKAARQEIDGRKGISLSCTSESFPRSNITWAITREGSSPKEIKVQSGSVFNITNQRISNQQEMSILTILLPEWLGQSEVRCMAKNIFENASASFQMNGRKRSFRGMTYIFSKADELSRETAIAYCSNFNAKLAKITDGDTQRRIAKASKGLQHFSARIDGIAQNIEGSIIWTWGDGTVVYNETKHGRWKSENDGTVDGSYVGWARYWPRKLEMYGNCLVLSIYYNRMWTNLKCTSQLQAICERPIEGKPTVHLVKADNCSAAVRISWSPSENATTIKHRVIITPFASDYVVKPPPQELIVTKKNYTHKFKNLTFSMKYKIQVYPCPGYCDPGAGVSYNFTTASGLPGKVLQANTSQLSKTVCVISWTNRYLPEDVTGYKIISHSILVHVVSNYLKTNLPREENEVSSNNLTYHHEVLPNRNYTFFVQAKTCAGYGSSQIAEGKCVTNRTAPTTLPALKPLSTVVSGVGAIEIDMPAIDQTNGPVSCLFILVNSAGSASSRKQVFEEQELRKASLSADQASDSSVYMSLALTPIEFSRNGESDNHAKLVIGDNRTTTCNVNQLPSNHTRNKRATNQIQDFTGRNRPLSKGKSYGIFIVSATPGDQGQVLYKTGESKRIGGTEQQNGTSSLGWIAGVVVGLLIAIILLMLLFIRRRKRLILLKSEDEGIELQQNLDPVYENAGNVQQNERSETDIPVDKLQTVYSAMKAGNNKGFREEYQGYGRASKFIATQGPLPDTVNDFWKMIVEKECCTIVMLTKCLEGGKKKCEKYWPDMGLEKTYGQIKVANEFEESVNGYIKRGLKVSSGQSEFLVHQFQFLKWPDHGVPVTTSSFFRLQRAVSKRIAEVGESPTVVHCSAGAGRTGAFIAYDYLSEEKEKLNRVDVRSCVLSMRRQRVQMVQNSDQYTFVYKLLLEDHLFGNTELSVEQVRNILRHENVNAQLAEEFSNLSLVEPIHSEMCGIKQDTMNRKKSILPYVHSRINIDRKEHEDSMPYLNASNIETYDDTFHVIAAQGPLESSVENFWRGIFDNDVAIIVMLTRCTEGKTDLCTQYWPNEIGESLKMDILSIETTMKGIEGNFITREFRVKKKKDVKKVVQYQLKDWPASQCPDDPKSVLGLVAKLKSEIRETRSSTVLIHCSDGAGRTGAFCALINLIDRLHSENVADVFRAAKDLRDYRPGMVQTLGQYRFCLEAIAAYLEASSVYSNFDVGRKEDAYASI